MYIIEHLLKDKEQNVCVKTCRTRFHDVNGTCVECNGPCPKGKFIILLSKQISNKCEEQNLKK